MKCPKCNKELEVLDMYDVEHDDDWCTEYLVGECPECGTEYRWERNFKYYSEDSLVEFR